MSYLNDHEEFSKFRFCPFCGGKVETGHIDLPIEESRTFIGFLDGLEGGGLLRTRWYADNKSANPDLICFAATGKKRTLAAYCERCSSVFAVLEAARHDGAIL